jgi:TolB-like protein/Tfp pilus assembly protein PilF
MWSLWPQLRRLWAGVGTVTAGLLVTWLYSLLSEQPLPHSRVALQILDDYWPWLGVALLALTTLSVVAERAHRRHAGQPVPAISEYLVPRFRSRPYLPWLAGGLGILIALTFGIVRWRAFTGTPEQAASQIHPIRSIAVLPLDNFSGDPKQEYFADGITDELTTDLATISALRVISRGSVMRFKGENRPPTPEIAKLLNVDAVIEGSVARVGDKVRVTAQLIDAPADRHLWAKSYERDSRDVLALQDEVALAIAREINVELTPHEQERLTNSRTVDPQAHDAYLKGRYCLRTPTEEGVRKALEQFEQAIRVDPNFAPAYSGIADAYILGEDFYFPPNEVMPKAKAAAEKALQLDDTLAEAHFSLGEVKFQYDFDWPGAETEFRRAIELNPSFAFGHLQYGFYLALRGRLDEAVAESRRANELDPLSPLTVNNMVIALTWQKKYEAAKEQGRIGLESDPNDWLSQWAIGWIDIEVGKFNEAVTELQKARVMDSPPVVAGWLGYAYAKSGERIKAEAIITELNQMSSRRYVDTFSIAIIYLGLGDKMRALDELEKGYEARDWGLLWLKMDRIFDPLRSEPRFIALMKKVGFDN